MLVVKVNKEWGNWYQHHNKRQLPVKATSLPPLPCTGGKCDKSRGVGGRWHPFGRGVTFPHFLDLWFEWWWGGGWQARFWNTVYSSTPSRLFQSTGNSFSLTVTCMRVTSNETHHWRHCQPRIFCWQIRAMAQSSPHYSTFWLCHLRLCMLEVSLTRTGNVQISQVQLTSR